MASTLPTHIKNFVLTQTTRRIEDLAPEWKASAKRTFPFEEYTYPMVASLLLSGRISPTSKMLPNKSEAIRWCKAANFNQYLFEWLSTFLVTSNILECGINRFHRGKNADALNQRDLDACRRAFFTAFITILDNRTPFRSYRSSIPQQSGFETFLKAFARAFQGLAIPADALAKVAADFSALPANEIRKAAGVGEGEHVADRQWFDDKGQEAFIYAIYSADAFTGVKDAQGRDWLYVSSDLEVILGMAKVKAPETTTKEFVVQSDLTVIVSCDHSLETLSTLQQFATIVSKGKILTFKLEPKAIKEASAKPESLKNFLTMLESHQNELPSTVRSLLSGATDRGDLGKAVIRGCRAIIKPETPELLNAIRNHSRLKGYLLSDAPPGYLLIKEKSDPFNFIKRCRECGFEITISS